MRVVNVKQRTDEWHAWRKLGVTASEVATILFRDPHKTPWRLWAEKIGKVEPEAIENSPLVRRGVGKERLARAEYERRHDEMLLPVCIESEDDPDFRASLDGLESTGRPVELKCPHPTTMRAILDKGEEAEPFQLYWPQVQEQIFCTGSDSGVLTFYCDELDERPGEVVWLEFPIKRDDEFIANEMIPGCKAFLELVRKKKEPPKDPERDLFFPDAALLPLWETAADGWLHTKKKMDALEKRLADFKRVDREYAAQFVEWMDNFMHAESCGVKVTRFVRQGAVDYGKLLKDKLPDLPRDEIEAYRKEGTPQVRVLPSESQAATRAKEHATRLKGIAMVGADEEPETRYDW